MEKSNATKLCSNCKNTVEEDFKFCPVCGFKLPQNDTAVAETASERKCSKCGRIVEEGDHFCMICGNRLDPVAPAPVESTVDTANIQETKSPEPAEAPQNQAETPTQEIKAPEIAETPTQEIKAPEIAETPTQEIKAPETKEEDVKNKVRFLSKQPSNGAIYEMYEADTAEDAKAFLLTKTVTEKFYYITVDAYAQGCWCRDIEGLYLENLLPYQSDLNKCECDTAASKFTEWSFTGIRMITNNLSDNFVAQVTCGKCGHEWYEGVTTKNDTAVRCPNCQAVNRHPKPDINTY